LGASELRWAYNSKAPKATPPTVINIDTTADSTFPCTFKAPEEDDPEFPELVLDSPGAVPVDVPNNDTEEIEDKGGISVALREVVTEKVAPVDDDDDEGFTEGIALVSEALDEAEAEEGETVPDPPAAADNCAKPTAGVPLLSPVLEEVVPRKTVYTFFRNTSPITQLGFPDPSGILLPKLRSNIPPRQLLDPCVTGPRFISLAEMGQEVPPKEMVVLMEVLHGKLKNPSCPCTASDPCTPAQKLWTASEGPPISVVPVSMAASGEEEPREIDCDWTVNEATFNNQKLGVPCTF
jgi:hypothetical protein